ncbi:MAG TPA: urease accessory UreF family protein, partial [Methylomirabilota bacterium]|nr:urease accessory UreF family protein [Methylomirabilota bacterium]
MTEATLAMLQFADGLFPAGGFAHSFGLETYAQDGAVTDRAGLEAFVVAHLEGSAGPADAVAVAAAVRLAPAGDVAGWLALDARLEAMKIVPETRAASRQMGRQTLRVAAALGADAFLADLA